MLTCPSPVAVFVWPNFTKSLQLKQNPFRCSAGNTSALQTFQDLLLLCTGTKIPLPPKIQETNLSLSEVDCVRSTWEQFITLRAATSSLVCLQMPPKNMWEVWAVKINQLRIRTVKNSMEYKESRKLGNRGLMALFQVFQPPLGGSGCFL